MKKELIKIGHRIRKHSDSIVIKRSDAYVDRVTNRHFQMDDRIYRADVSNAAGKTYHVKWTLPKEGEDKAGSFSCTCPAHRQKITLPCKHALAAFRSLLYSFC